jgi:hypothetical protein
MIEDEVLRDAIREGLLAKMREWSEDHYCAGWLIGLESKIHRLEDEPQWRALGEAVGWPIGCEADSGWETWEEAGERYKTPAYLEFLYGTHWRQIVDEYGIEVVA